MHWILDWTLKIFFYVTMITVITFYFIFVYCYTWDIVYSFRLDLDKSDKWYKKSEHFWLIEIVLGLIMNCSLGVIMCATIYQMTRLIKEINHNG